MFRRLFAASSLLALLAIAQPCVAQQSERDDVPDRSAGSRKRMLPADPSGDSKAGVSASSDSRKPPLHGSPVVLPPSPSLNVDMTWDGGELRPIGRGRKFQFYSRPRVALTSFDVVPFESRPMYRSPGGYRECFLVPQGVSIEIYGYGWQTRRVEVCD